MSGLQRGAGVGAAAVLAGLCWVGSQAVGAGSDTGLLSVWGSPGENCTAPPGPDGGDLEGLTGRNEADAAAAAQDRGLTVRIVARDGEWFPVTQDHRDDRVNFVIENGVVVQARIG